MSGTLSMMHDRGCTTQSAEEAINVLYGPEHKSVIVYAPTMERLIAICDEIYAEITKRNKEIPDVNDQMLPTDPYFWDDIDGCLPLKCAEIGMDTFAKSAECVHLFAQPRYSCLTNPLARKPLCSKALTSLAMLGSFITKGDK